MSELGVFAVDRGIFDHPMFQRDLGREPFTKLEAWVWLLAEASWKPRTVNISGQAVKLARGQLAHSVRYMAQAWGWPKSNVARFLDRLKTGTLIRAENGTAYSVITICKYDAYQRVSLPSGTANGTPGGTEVGQQRDRIEDIQGIQLSEEPKGSLSEPAVADTSKPKKSRGKYSEDFEAAWRAYPTDKLMSKAKAFTAWQRIAADDRPKVMAGIPGFVAFCAKDSTYRPVHMVRFISERRFDGFAATGTEAVTEADWQRRLIYARARLLWSSAEWGPMPGETGCMAPASLLVAGDGRGWKDKDAAPRNKFGMKPGDGDHEQYRGVL